MAREIFYLVEAFKPGQDKKMTAEPAIRGKSTDGACKRAELLAGTKAGVVAFSASGDPELGEHDDKPRIIFKAGRLPAAFEDA